MNLYPPNAPVALTLQQDGRMVLVGAAGTQVDDWKFAAARFDGDSTLLAASPPRQAISASIASDQVQPLLAEAVSRWQAAGVDVSALRGIDIRITDLGGTTLGFASGHTIWLDDNAAGWGWFVDTTPWDDSTLETGTRTTPTSQWTAGDWALVDLAFAGEQNPLRRKLF